MTDIAELGFRADSRELKAAARVLDDVSGSAKKTEGATSKLNREFDNQTRGAAALGSGLKALQGALAAIGFSQLVRQLVSVTDTYAGITGRLKLVTSGSADLAQVQEKLLGIAQRTGTEYESVALLYTKVARSASSLGLSQANLLKFTEATNQALQVSGASTAEAAGGVQQLSQALASGLLRGDEFNSVMESTPRVAQAIADGLNVPIGALRQMAAQGQLTAQLVTQALLSQSAVLQAEFDQLPATVGRATTRLQNELKKVLSSTDMTPLVASIDKLREVLSDPPIVSGIATLAAGLVNASRAATLAASGFGEFGAEIGYFFASLAGNVSESDKIEKSIERIQKALALSPGVERQLFAASDYAKSSNAELQKELEARQRLLARFSEGSPFPLTLEFQNGIDAAAGAIARLNSVLPMDLNASITVPLREAAAAVAPYADATTLAERATQSQADAEMKKQMALAASAEATKQAQEAEQKANASAEERVRVLLRTNELVRQGIEADIAAKQAKLEVDGVNKATIATLIRLESATTSLHRNEFKEFASAKEKQADAYDAEESALDILISKQERINDLIRQGAGAEEARNIAAREYADLQSNTLQRKREELDLATKVTEQEVERGQAALASKQYLESLGRSYQRQIDEFGRGPAQSRYNSELDRIDDVATRRRDEAQSQISSGALKGQAATDRLAQIDSEQQQAVQMWNSAFDQIEARQREFGLGFSQTFAQYADGVKNLGSLIAGDLVSSLQQATASTSDLLANSILWGEGGTEAAKEIARTILTQVVSSLIRVGIQYGINSALQAANIGATTTASVASIGAITAASIPAATAVAAAWAPAALAVSLGTAGANAAGAAAGITTATGVLVASLGASKAAGVVGGAFANGGDPPVGAVSLVGERGPELFVPKRAGTIIPADQSAKMLKGSGDDGIKIIINNNAPGVQATASSGVDEQGRQIIQIAVNAAVGQMMKDIADTGPHLRATAARLGARILPSR